VHNSKKTPSCTVAKVRSLLSYAFGIAALVMIYHQFYPTIYIKTPAEIVKMRLAGRLASEVLEYITPHVKAGVSTGELNDLCHKYITQVQEGVPAPLGYLGFPKSVCTSVNAVVCHGIPSYEEFLEAGDILNIDVTVMKDGYHGDTSKMFAIGEVGPDSIRLVAATRRVLLEAIRMVRPGKPPSSTVTAPLAPPPDPPHCRGHHRGYRTLYPNGGHQAGIWKRT